MDLNFFAFRRPQTVGNISEIRSLVWSCAPHGNIVPRKHKQAHNRLDDHLHSSGVIVGEEQAFPFIQPRIISMASWLRVKTKTSRFCSMRSLWGDLGITTTSDCSRNRFLSLINTFCFYCNGLARVYGRLCPLCGLNLKIYALCKYRFATIPIKLHENYPLYNCLNLINLFCFKLNIL